MGKVGPLPRGRQTICFALAMVLGWVGGVAREGHSPLLLPFVLILELGTGVRRFYFFPRAPAKDPITLSTPVLLCFSGMCFHLKTTLGHFFFPVLKIEKFLQYEQGCGGGGVSAVRGDSVHFGTGMGWLGWEDPHSPPPRFFS